MPDNGTSVDRRWAFICVHKDCVPPRRTFLLPGDAEPPRCPDHGPMRRQANMPYERPDPSTPVGRPRKVQAKRKAKP